MRAEVPNPKKELLPGTFVYVHVFVTDKIQAIAIPPEVLSTDQIGEYLFIADKNNTVQQVYVEPIFESRFFILVKEGTLKGGDKVIVSGLMHMKKGIQVKPTDVTDTEGMDAIIKKNNLLPELPKEKN
jgi:multidrug efflux pump subunit AcrA (membrane-fusion protein)